MSTNSNPTIEDEGSVQTPSPADSASGKSKSGSESRNSRRYNYPATQYIARYRDGKMPEKSEFRAVRCFDLSAAGFSYLSPRPVERGKIVVALGTGPQVVYVATEIVHCAPIGAGTTLQFRVGCRFIERLAE